MSEPLHAPQGPTGLIDETVWHKGKAYRKGYTTGSCATAAAKVAALMVLRQQIIHQVSIVTLWRDAVECRAATHSRS